MPTRAQVLAYIADIRAATPADPISHTEFADLMEAFLNHITATGAWDPTAQMAIAANKADVANATFTGITAFARIAGASATPAIAAGTGAGTTPTVSIVGNDLAGRITIVTGTTPAANATIVTITFAGGAFSTAPFVTLTPSNQPAAALSGVTMVFPGSTTTTFVITSGTTALTAATTYTFNYLIAR